jgi:hypothetical protein
MTKLILITFESYTKIALHYNLDALDYIVDNMHCIVDIEFVNLDTATKE